MAERYLQIADQINRAEGRAKFPDFPARFYVVERGRNKFPVEEFAPGVVQDVPECVIVDAILRYCTEDLARFEGYALEYAQAVKAMLFWRSYTNPIPMPKQVAEKSEPGLCFHRLPFDSAEDPTLAPQFEELLGRCTNARALATFIGSLFFDDSDRQQYVWLVGGGGEGKGALMRLLHKLLGHLYHSESIDAPRDKFWTSGLLDKRLVVFPDTNNSSQVGSSVIKSITGDDLQRIEIKGGAIYTARLSCKLMFSSQEMPLLSSQKADLRRIILCEVSPLKCEFDPRYEEKLWAEAPYILGACKLMYREHVKSGAVMIPVDNSAAIDIAAANEEPYEIFFQRYFRELPGDCAGISGETLAEFLARDGVRDTRLRAKYIAYMQRQHGVRRKRTNHGMRYYGLVSNTLSEIEEKLRVRHENDGIINSENAAKVVYTKFSLDSDFS